MPVEPATVRIVARGRAQPEPRPPRPKPPRARRAARGQDCINWTVSTLILTLIHCSDLCVPMSTWCITRPTNYTIVQSCKFRLTLEVPLPDSCTESGSRGGAPEGEAPIEGMAGNRAWHGQAPHEPLSRPCRFSSSRSCGNLRPRVHVRADLRVAPRKVCHSVVDIAHTRSLQVDGDDGDVVADDELCV